jgi:peroxiredoxin
MKKTIKKYIPLLAIALFFFMGFTIANKIYDKKQKEASIQVMPSFGYKTLDGSLYTNKNLKENTATIFIYFNSDCDFCNHEAQEIQTNIEKLKKFQLVFISFEKPAQIKAFAQTHKLNNYDNISFIHDSRASFATTFDIKSLPAIVIYDNQNKLVAKMKGQTKVATIIKKISN